MNILVLDGKMLDCLKIIQFSSCAGVATLASFPLLTWSFFNPSKDREH